MRTMLLFAAMLALAAPVTASDWQDIKDPQALKSLYSNKTFKGKDWMDRPFVGHFKADGSGVLITFDGTRIPRTWRVEGDGRVCIKTQMGATCYRYEQNAQTSSLYRITDTANGTAVLVSVEDGAPNF